MLRIWRDSDNNLKDELCQILNNDNKNWMIKVVESVNTKN